ncbi:MAG: PilT/PilU family type 4a pilus ATPase [Polyangiaceae bacterium]|nr:PilT/PilU family type 4a pilus ATPase [Polyangiaceae bacterium]
MTKRPGAALAFDAIVLRATPGAREEKAATRAAPVAPAPARDEPPPRETARYAPAPSAVEASRRPRAETPPPPPPVVAQHQHPYRLANSLEELVARAIDVGASDVHVSETDPPVMRVHGRLVPFEERLTTPLFELLRSSFGPYLDARLGDGASCDLALELPRGARGRVNVYATSRGLAMALRILPREVPALKSLGFPVPLDDLARLPNGLVLVTGATGSGKSTTLAALTQEAVATRSVVLVTLEDPIEYVFDDRGTQSLIRQRQIGRDVRDFATGLRDALREDPDVLLIGEMRDAESIQLALTAAETGHLVLASLHSRSAVSAVERIIDTYPPERQGQIRVMLADSLRAVVAQRLIPRESGEGRVLAAEVMRVTTSVASSIRDGKPSAIRSAMQAGRGEGMIPLERSLVDLVKKRAISVETARASANDAATLAQYMAT